MKRLSKKPKMRVLAVAPHPDDIEIGCAGALIKLAKAGHEITLAIMTKGEAGGDPALRQREQETAAKLYKAKQIYWLGFHDTRVPLSKESIDALDRVMREVKPDLVFAPWGEDTHQDHRATSAQVRSATRYTKNVLFYEVPSTIDFLPDVYVDITKELPSKFKALKAHKSQVHKVNVADLSIIDCAQALAFHRGFQGRVKAAEGFKALRLLLEI
jgi:LmbE family N-acetylglucosaminyl deacetylase